MKYILSVDNILVDSLEVYHHGYFEAKPLPGIKEFLRNQLILDNELLVICKNSKQKFFVTKNFPYIKDENIIVDDRICNQIDLVEDILGRPLSENDRLIDSPPHLAKLNNANVVVAVNDAYFFDDAVEDYDFSRYQEIYKATRSLETF